MEFFDVFSKNGIEIILRSHRHTFPRGAYIFQGVGGNVPPKGGGL